MPRKILIVDDSTPNRMMLRRMLSSEYEVLEAADGRAALAVIERHQKELSAILLDIVMPVLDGYGVLEQLRADAALSQIPVIVTTSNTENDAEIKALTLGANDFITKPYNPGIIRRRLKNTINLRETAATVNALQRDPLTGLYTRETFFQKAEELINARKPGYYVMACLDIDNFKVINDQYGTSKGDAILRHVADVIWEGFEKIGGLACRVTADDFAVIYPADMINTSDLAAIREAACAPTDALPAVSISIGRYVISDLSLPVSAMYDRAAIAQHTVKGRFDTGVALYDESMRQRLLREQEIIDDMQRGLDEKQFEVWLQPQYDHSTGALVGAEALVRWRHPVRGLIPPFEFIPLFERNGFIYPLDRYVWERTCALIQEWAARGMPPLPISVNVSRYDLFQRDLLPFVNGLVTRFGIPKDMLRLEITETAFESDTERIIGVVRSLVDAGFTVEIDDFGSGYSSLNTLKDVPAQIVKLDMRFLESGDQSGRGGNILESIVRMTRWLGLAVIAEGVETQAQADYLRSIGCSCMQGYLYAMPMPAADFESLAAGEIRRAAPPALETVKHLNHNAFWNPESIDTLIFNSYVGGACIFEYGEGRVELLRATEKYAKVIGSAGMTVADALRLDWAQHLDADNRARLAQDIATTIETGDDVTGEYVFLNLPGCPEKTYLRSTLRVIASAGSRHLVYCTNENITRQVEAQQNEKRVSERMQAVLSHMSGGITAVVIQGRDVRFLFANDRFYTLFGYTRERFHEVVSDSFDLIHPEDKPRVRQTIHEITQTGQPVTLEYRAIRGDGEVIWVRFAISVTHFDGVDEPVLLGMVMDITQERQSAGRIRALNETLVNMMNDTPGGFARLQVMPDGTVKVVYFNDSYCKMRGRTREELQNTAADPLFGIHPDDVPQAAAAMRNMVATGKPQNVQCRLLHERDRYLPVNIFGRASEGEAGETYINVYIADLSEPEKRAFTIRETMPYVLGAIMEHSADLTFAKDRDLRYICCSPAFARMCGAGTQENVVGKTDYELFPKELADRFRADDLRLMEEGKPLVDYIEPIKSDDGTQHYSSTSKYILHDGAGNVVGMYGIGRDVTKVRTAFEQLQLLTDAIPGGLATYTLRDGALALTYFNDGLCRMLGYTRAEYEAATRDDVMTVVHAEDSPRLQSQIAAMTRDGTPVDCTYRVHIKDGSIKWINVRATPAERVAGALTAHAVFFDVTEQKLAEEAARMHEQEMQLAMAQMGRMICEYDPATRTLTVTEAFAARYNMPAALPNVPDSLIDAGVIHPDTVPACRAFYDAILRGEKTGAAEFRDRQSDGVYRWQKVEFFTIFSSDGTPGKAIIAVEDTTAMHLRYEMERARPTQGEEALIARGVFNLSQGGKTLEYVTSGGVEVPLRERMDIYGGGQRLAELLPFDDDRARYRELHAIDRLLALHKQGVAEHTIEYRRLTPEGDIIWARNDLRVLPDPATGDMMLFAYGYSIDEQKTFALIDRTLIRDNYEYVLRVNAASRMYAALAASDGAFPPGAKGADIDAAFRELAQTCVHPADREKLLRSASVAGIRRRLQKADSFRLTYRCVACKDDVRHKRLTFTALDRQREVYIAACEDVTALVREEARKNELLKAALAAANEETRVRERETAQQIQAIMNNVDGGVSAATLVNDEIRYLYVNDTYYAMFGYTREQFDAELPRALVDCILPEDLPGVYGEAYESEKTGKTRMEFRARKRDGTVIWVRAISSTCDMVGVETPVHIAVLFDITSEREAADALRMSEEQFRIAASIGGRAIARYDIKTGVFHHENPILLEMGLPQVLKDAPRYFAQSGLIAPEFLPAYAEFFEKLHRGESCEMDFRLRMPDGAFRWHKQEGTVIRDAAGNPSQAIFVLSDITESQARVAEFRERAESDPLTGMLNRAAFAKAVQELIDKDSKKPKAQRKGFALMMLDFDGFKLINDTFGHAMGDQVLVDTAKSLRGILRPGDLLGRFGGDEFLICLPGMPGDEAIARKARQVCTSLHRALSMEVYTSASIGVAVYPRDGEDYETLSHRMDAALYAVKNNGKNGFAFYSDAMSERGAHIGLPLGEGTPGLITQRKRRLLIVDDNDASLRMLSNIFRDEYQVEVARDGAEALQTLRQLGLTIAAVLLDLMMPGVDGFAVLDEMRTNVVMRAIPVIVVSVMDEQETSMRVLRAGAADYVTKPVNPDLLRLRVQSVISRAENDRLRAQNSLLLMHNTEAAKYRAALDSAGVLVAEYQPEGDMFFYDAALPRHIRAAFDDRPLWDILSQDAGASAGDAQALRHMIERAADAPGDDQAPPPSPGVVVTLHTPSGASRRFLVNAKRRADAPGMPGRVVITMRESSEF